MAIINLLSVFYILFLIKCVISDVNFDENDILNIDFMPGTLLMIDKHTKDNFDNITASLIHKNKQEVFSNGTTVVDGNFNEAFSTMKFHRKMMNEYLCHNFVADQILGEITPAKLFYRRMGEEKPMPFQTTESPRKRTGRLSAISAVKENLLTDPGSSNYKDWLSKTTTLEDIYRHYGADNTVNNRIDTNDIEMNTHREDFDSDVTGFAVVNPSPSRVPTVANMPKVGATGYGGGGFTGYGHSSGGYQEPIPAHYAIPIAQSHSGGGGHDYGHQQQQYHEPQHFVHYHHKKGNKKEMILKDLFDIALTALAFLSFGIFAIQVILCIAAAATTTTTTAATFLSMVDGTATGTGGTATGGTATGGTAPASGPAIIIANDAIIPPAHSSPDTYGGNTHNHNGYKTSHRNRREAESSPFYIENNLRNEIARRVLVSMEAIFIADQDNGHCLRREICANNKFSRTLSNNQKLWIPVYGLALSWLTGRLSTNMPPAAAMLESLKASALGLGNADCDAIYPNCNLNQERTERLRRRRRKRSANSTNDFT